MANHCSGASDIINVGIFLESYGVGSYEEHKFYNGDFGPVTSSLVKALNQKVDVVIASSVLVSVMVKAVYGYNPESVISELKSGIKKENKNKIIYEKKVNEFEETIKKGREEIKEKEQLINELKEAMKTEDDEESLVFYKEDLEKVEEELKNIKKEEPEKRLENEKKIEETRAQIVKCEKRIREIEKNKVSIEKLIKNKEDKEKIIERMNKLGLSMGEKRPFLGKKDKKDIDAFALRLEDKNLLTYMTKDGSFVVFVNKKNKKKISLGSYGLNENLKKLDKNDILKSIVAEKAYEYKGRKWHKKSEIGYINTDVLKSIFKKDEKDRTDKRKIIFLAGHGSFGVDPRVAQLTIDQYADLVSNYFDKINCKFLFVLSCFAGGVKIENVFKEIAKKQHEVYEKVSIKFPIAICSISDVEAYLFEDMKYASFFDGVSKLIEARKGVDQSKAEMWVTREPFRSILKDFVGPLLENTTLIRFPGIRKFFRAVNVDKKVKIITYESLLGRELKGVKVRGETIKEKLKREKIEQKVKKITAKIMSEEKQLLLKKRGIPKAPSIIAYEKWVEKRKLAKPPSIKDYEKWLKERKVAKVPAIEEYEKWLKEREVFNKWRKNEIERRRKLNKELAKLREKGKKAIEKGFLPIKVENKEAILLYPTVLLPAIEIIGKEAPALVSMFPGNVCHFIRKFDAKDIALDTLLRDMVARLAIRSNKVFLFGDIICKNYENSGLKGTELNLKKVFLQLSFDEKMRTWVPECFFTIDTKKKKLFWDKEAQVLKIIDFDYDKKYITDLVSKYTPSKEAYMEATGGIETSRTLDEALKKYFF